MKKALLSIGLVFTSVLSLWAQDQLVVPSVNPLLFPQGERNVLKPLQTQQKLNVLEDSLIYRYDTLSLPFIDDFTANRLSKRVTDVNDSRVSDTTVYKLFFGGQVYLDTIGFVTDSTFYFQIAADSTLISRRALFNGIVQEHNIQVFPTIARFRDIYEPYNIFDTVGRPIDTIPVNPNLKQDSATYYFVETDTNTLYVDRDVYINETFGINPPTRGVATFDGLTEFGLPYNIDQRITVQADFLTSKPIDLSNAVDSVYLSFFFQPKGRSLDRPERGDSLVLEFYNSDIQRWGKVWGTPGGLSDVDTIFQQIMLGVDSQYISDAFQFRFRAYASSAGAFDQWHIDYIYLDDERTINDTTAKDIAFVDAAPSLLADFHAMPWWHFKPNPGNFMIDAVNNLRVKSQFENGLNVFNKLVIPDTVNQTIFYREPVGSQFSIIGPQGELNFSYPINFDYDPSYIQSAGTLSAIIDIDFRPAPNTDADFIRRNDSLFPTAILDDYYAYDDGTAEAGYGINPSTSGGGLFSFMAVEFNMPFADTIGGVQIYFLPQRFNFDNNPITSQSFQLTIWSSLNPAQIVYQRPILDKPIYSDDNGFVTFWLDTLIPVNQTFYVGLRAIGPLSLNLGYDFNNNNRDKIFWSLDGSSWSNPSNRIFDGSVMLRPVFRKKSWGVGLPVLQKPTYALSVYPNPAKENVWVNIEPQKNLRTYQLFDLNGRLIQSGNFKPQMDVSSLPRGIYFLRLQSQEGDIFTEKLMLTD